MSFDDSELTALYRYCLALTGNPDTAYDLLHDGYEKWLRTPKPAFSSKLNYARTLIRNHWYDQIRRQKKWQSIIEQQSSVASPIELDEQSLENTMISRQLLEFIWQTLEPKDREVLFLWAVEGHSVSEIAELMQSKRGTLLSRLHRIKQRIKQHVNEQGYLETQDRAGDGDVT